MFKEGNRVCNQHSIKGAVLLALKCVLEKLLITNIQAKAIRKNRGLLGRYFQVKIILQGVLRLVLPDIGVGKVYSKYHV